MHKKSMVFRRWLATLAMFGLVASGAVVLVPAAHASNVDASGGLEFLRLGEDPADANNSGWNPDVLEDAVVGDFYLYEDVMSGVDAKVTVTRLVNSRGGSNTLMTEKIDDHTSDSAENKWIRSEVRRLGSAPAGERTSVEFRIDFLDSSNNSLTKTLENLKVNVYDLDNLQGFEVNNVGSYLVSTETQSIVQQREDLGNGFWRFTSEDKRASDCTRNPSDTDFATQCPLGLPHSQGEARVQVNFAPTTSLTFTLLFFDEEGSIDFDFTKTGALYGLPWINNQDVTINPPIASSTSVSLNAPAPVSNPVMAAIDVNPTNITVDNEIITILGANLNTVTEVYIGGIKVPIFTQSGNRLQIRAPKGLTGLVDLELKSYLNDVLMTRKLNFKATAAVGTKREVLIIGGFAHNSRKLTPKMQARIERWLDKHSDLSTLTCTGFTSLPRRTTDVTLSTNRGKTACSFSKKQRSDLKTRVSQGIEDPRPGSNVRRVRLVLTP